VFYKRNCILTTLFSCCSDVEQTTSSLYSRIGVSHGQRQVQVDEIIEPPPTRIWYCYSEFQPTFNNYPRVHFHEGLAELSDRVFDGLESTLIIFDDLISETSQQTPTCLRKFRIIASLTQNVCDKNKYARTISLNAHYLKIRNPRDASQFATLARQMYPNASKFAIEAYKDATSAPCSADRPETRTSRAMSFENERISWRKSIRLRQSRQIIERHIS